MTLNYLKIEEAREGVYLLTINKPASLNALDTAVLGELAAVVEDLRTNESVKVLVLTGEGRAFVAGADISEMVSKNPIDGLEFGRLGASVFRAIEQLPFPVIAAVNGFALGGGCELAMACDIRLASAKAKFGQPETGLGIIPGFSGTQRLPRLVGPAKAKELIYTGEIIKADEALRIGLVNGVTEPEALIDEALAMAEKIALQPRQAVALAKKAIDAGMQTDIDTAIGIENNLFALCFSTEEQKQRMTAFLNKK
ncbi:MAG: enoyl-CoA hydratase-related protein [Prevotella sp.]|nr:enoyl-CoA hydratase-related protein [Prevotella sp.]CDE07150.1 3-hydroxybutyryl-CoA dehydratase [Prevotella sp. CAG:485]